MSATGQIAQPRSPSHQSRIARLLAPATLLLLGGLLAPLSTAAAPRVVRVGVYDNPPKIFLSHGRASGIFGALLDAVARRADWTVVPVACQWQQCLALLEAGEIDLMPDVGYSPERARALQFGKVPALYSWSEVYRNPQVRLQSIRDLAGKRIAVLAGSVQQPYLENMVASFGLRGVRLIAVSTLAEGFDMAASGRADAVVANNFYGEVQGAQRRIETTPILFQPVRLFFATARGRNGALLATIDTYLGKWQAQSNSPYYTVVGQWKAVPVMPVPRAVWWGLAALCLLLAVALGAMLVQRRLVADRTRSLRISEAKLAVILDSIDACVYIKDTDLRYRYINRRAEAVFGLSPDALGRTDDELVRAGAAVNSGEADRRVLGAGQRETIEEDIPAVDGTLQRHFLTVKQPLQDERGGVYALCSIATEFTEQKQSQEQIHRLAFYDVLTQLPNRRLLLDRAEHALANSARSGLEGALLFIDLDNFKVLNDTRGHTRGDELLKHVAQRLGAQIRHSDTLARLGGDEFVLLMENLAGSSAAVAAQVSVVAEKLLHELSEPYLLDQSTCNISASIGVALFSDAQGSVEELLKRADMAMYAAKAAGRQAVKFFNPYMQELLAARAIVESGLSAAMADNQLLLHYQPQVDAGHRLIGAEALIRWLHPQRGLIPPSEFIPVAEASGQILALGRWVLHAACRQLVVWSGHPQLQAITVAVNVSARQFRHPDFVEDVLAALADSGANPQRLELELTESVLVEDVENLIAKMEQLKRYGVRFALDDFGTGYSSLAYLKRLPLDQLKIDKSFVRDLLVDANDETIVKTIVALGESMELAVIAEGVETESQRLRLIELGCTRHQGFLFGRPVPANIFESAHADGTSLRELP